MRSWGWGPGSDKIYVLRRRDTGELIHSLFTVWRHSEEAAVWEPSSDTGPPGILILKFQSPELWENLFQLLSHQVCMVFVVASQAKTVIVLKLQTVSPTMGSRSIYSVILVTWAAWRLPHVYVLHGSARDLCRVNMKYLGFLFSTLGETFPSLSSCCFHLALSRYSGSINQ